MAAHREYWRGYSWRVSSCARMRHLVSTGDHNMFCFFSGSSSSAFQAFPSPRCTSRVPTHQYRQIHTVGGFVDSALARRRGNTSSHAENVPGADPCSYQRTYNKVQSSQGRECCSRVTNAKFANALKCFFSVTMLGFGFAIVFFVPLFKFE